MHPLRTVGLFFLVALVVYSGIVLFPWSGPREGYRSVFIATIHGVYGRFGAEGRVHCEKRDIDAIEDLDLYLGNRIGEASGQTRGPHAAIAGSTREGNPSRPAALPAEAGTLDVRDRGSVGWRHRRRGILLCYCQEPATYKLDARHASRVLAHSQHPVRTHLFRGAAAHYGA